MALTFLPLLAACFLLFVPEKRNVYGVALWLACVHMVLACVLWWKFDPALSGYQYVIRCGWLGELSLHFGVDAVSILFIPLTSLLVLLCIAASPQHYPTAYWVFLLVAEAALTGTFCSMNLISFYIFFESVLTPCFFLIGLWGGENRRYACMKFFLYTFAGSILMLVGLILVWQHTGLDNFEALYAMKKALPYDVQHHVWWLFVLALAVKIPMLPVHTWLPHAHVEAPMVGSVLLAGVMLKMGGYGLLRLVLPLAPDACITLAPWMMYLSVAAILYASCVAYGQSDIKRLIAYASVAHMGYMTLAIFTLKPLGVQGGIFQMISHGITAAGLFFIIGFLYERTHNRHMDEYRGLVQKMPGLSFAMMIFTLASIGLPGTIGFWGEFLAITTAYTVSPYVASMGAFGMVLGAAYMLRLYRTCFWGQAPQGKVLPPLTMQESITLGILCLIVIVVGVCPKLLTHTIQTASQHVLITYAR